MCELLGMECNTPTDLVFSFTGFASRGGRTGPHADGWGVAFYEGRAARIFLEPNPCAQSPLAEYLRTHSIKTELSIAHIRRRTAGPVALANTHPFSRELWGRSWVFAHNGTVKAIKKHKLGRFTPIGGTDSEHAFCVLLEALRANFKGYPDEPRKLFEAVASIGAEISGSGPFNFLLGDGQHLFARCDTRLCYIVRQAPFGRATLADEDVSVDFAAITTPRDRVAVIATAPLTRDEVWTHGEPGTLWVFRKGKVEATLASRSPDTAERRRVLAKYARDAKRGHGDASGGIITPGGVPLGVAPRPAGTRPRPAARRSESAHPPARNS